MINNNYILPIKECLRLGSGGFHPTSAQVAEGWNPPIYYAFGIYLFFFLLTVLNLTLHFVIKYITILRPYITKETLLYGHILSIIIEAVSSNLLYKKVVTLLG